MTTSAEDFVPQILKAYNAVHAIHNFQSLAKPHNIGEALKQLIAADARGHTPLHHAASSGNVELAVLLASVLSRIRTNVPVMEARDALGYTPLHWAIKRSPSNVVVALVEAGASVDAVDYEGRSCLHMAVEEAAMARADGNSDRVKFCEDLTRYLLDRNANSNSPDGAGATPVHYAAELGEDEIFKILVEFGGGKVNQTDFEGETPLFYAVREQLPETVKTLAGYGVDVSVRNDSMESVLDYNKSINGSSVIASILEAHIKSMTGNDTSKDMMDSSDVLGFSQDVNSSIGWMASSASHAAR